LGTSPRAHLYIGLVLGEAVVRGLFAVPCSALWANSVICGEASCRLTLLGQRQAHPANAQVSGVTEFSAPTGPHRPASIPWSICSTRR